MSRPPPPGPPASSKQQQRPPPPRSSNNNNNNNPPEPTLRSISGPGPSGPSSSFGDRQILPLPQSVDQHRRGSTSTTTNTTTFRPPRIPSQAGQGGPSTSSRPGPHFPQGGERSPYIGNSTLLPSYDRRASGSLDIGKEPWMEGRLEFGPPMAQQGQGQFRSPQTPNTRQLYGSLPPYISPSGQRNPSLPNPNHPPGVQSQLGQFGVRQSPLGNTILTISPDKADDGSSPGVAGGGKGTEGEVEEEETGIVIVPGLTATGRKRRPHATRKRVVQSCSECRRRKIKCDKKFPCGPCISRAEESLCQEVGMPDKTNNGSPSTYATASDLTAVATRLDALESALTKSGALDPGDMESYLHSNDRVESVLLDGDESITGGDHPAVSRQSVKKERRDTFVGEKEKVVRPIIPGPSSPAREPQPQPPPRQSVPFIPESLVPKPSTIEQVDSERTSDTDVDPQDNTECAALTLEHLAFGRSTAAGTHAIPHFGANKAQLAISKHAPNNDYHLVRPNPVPLQGNTPPTSINEGGSGSNHRPHSTGDSPLSLNMGDRRKSSLLSGHGALSGSIGGTGKGKGKEGSVVGSYGENLSREERIDTLLDLIGPMDVFQLFYRKTDVGLRAMTKVLPDRDTGELLVRTYLEKVDWLYRCLHIPTFLRQCNDLWALPHEMIVHEIALPFVALYLSVCCLGVQFMDTNEARKHFSPEEIRDLPDLYFNAARSCMWAADFVGQHTTENLQCLILLGVFMNNRDRGEAAWALLGAAIKMAQGLGLSRLGAEPTEKDTVKTSPMWTGRWESVIEREVGRRIWWNLVFLDWALSPSYNFSCSIHPDQIKTAIPSNIEDEDLIDRQPLSPQPQNIRTRMSFVLARIRFIQITYRQICEANLHRHPPYSFILSVDSELRQSMVDLPEFFQPNSVSRDTLPPSPSEQSPRDLVQHYESTMLNLGIHARMLRLHRPWMSRGYTDEKFAYSKEQCIRAARASLRLMGDTQGTAAFLEKWWLPLFYVSVSGLVVIIDLLRTNRRDMHSSETEEKISEVRGALDQMRQIADVSHPSRSAVKVMEFLLAEVEERRRPPGTASTPTGTGNKRKAPEDRDDETDGLQRAVKKLIRQAQLETDSPISSLQTVSSSTPPAASPLTPTVVSPSKDRPIFDAYQLLPSAGTLQSRSDHSGRADKSRGSGSGVTAPSGGGGGQGGQNRTGNPNMGSTMLDFSLNHNPSTSNSTATGSGSAVNKSSLGNIPNFPQFDTQYSHSQSPYPLFPSLDLNSNNTPGSSFSFPQFQPDPLTSGPQLDPSVETLLANYFPTPQQQQQQQQQNISTAGNMGQLGTSQNPETWGTVPDDFLSRVFSFSWDTATPSAGIPSDGWGHQSQQQQSIPPRQGSLSVGMNGANVMGQSRSGQGDQNQYRGLGGESSSSTLGQGQNQGQGGQGMDFVPYDWGTSSGGWMA